MIAVPLSIHYPVVICILFFQFILLLFLISFFDHSHFIISSAFLGQNLHTYTNMKNKRREPELREFTFKLECVAPFFHTKF